MDPAWFTLTCASSGPALQRHVRRELRWQGSLRHAERQLHPRRAVHGHDSQEPGPRCGSGRCRPNTDTLPVDDSWSFTVASGTEPAYPSGVHLAMGNPSAAGSDPSNYLMEKPEFAFSYNRDLGRRTGKLAPVRRMDRHADARRHVPPRPADSAGLVSRAVLRLLRQRLRSRPHDAQRRPRQGDVDPDQPGDVPDDEHGRAGARQQPGPMGVDRSLPPHARRATQDELYIVSGPTGVGAREALAA